jgi:hypothetical protein
MSYFFYSRATTATLKKDYPNFILSMGVADHTKQYFGSGFIKSSSGSRIYYQKLEIFYFFFFNKNCNLFIPWPPKRMSKLQEKPSALKREHPALQNMIFFIFLYGPD